MSNLYREEPCKTALNQTKGMPFRWTLNPYMGCVHRCTYCYVRAYEKRADRPSDERYGTSIRVKTNVAQVLRWELEKRSWRGETVVIGAATDPYQPAEGTYRLTRQCIEVLSARRNPFGIITRGPMIVRDAELLAEASSRADVGVNVSIPTLDMDVWRKTEPGTSPPRQRFRAVKTLVDAGVKVNVAMAPVLPGISDAPEQTGGGRQGGARGGCDRPVGEPPPPPAGYAGALHEPPGAGLAGAARPLPGALPPRRLPQGRGNEADTRPRRRAA